MTDVLSNAGTVGTPDPDQVATAKDLAAALTSLRARAGRSIRSIARSSGIPSATLGGYFSGRHLPPATQPEVFEMVLAEVGVIDPDEAERWRAALARARRTGSRMSSPVPAGPGHDGPTPEHPAPYRGLEPYTERDASQFLGREKVVDALVAEVVHAAEPGGSRAIVVVGASGSGKSSVLRAGLVPAMKGRDTDPWHAVVMVPGTNPCAALAAARAHVAGAARSLIVVDQAEEAFSPEVSEDSRRDFIRELTALTSSDPTAPATTVVVAGLRADFYGQAASDPDLLPVLQDHQVVLGSMAIADLRRAIVQPAGDLGVRVDPALVDLLVRDLVPRGMTASGYEAGALPLVSHAMLASWQRHTGQQVTVADYLACGGISGAVQQTAEGVVSRLNRTEVTAAQWLFGQLVSVDGDGLMTRRRVSHDDLRHPDRGIDLALDDVIEAFVGSRLLTADNGTLQISHEALLQAWPRLHEWVLSDLDDARLQQRIADAAATWRERDREPGALLRGGLLADAQTLAARSATSHRVLTPAEREFVEASAAEAGRLLALDNRRTQRLRVLLATMTALAVLAGALAGLALRAGAEARHQEQVAGQARDEALSRQLAIVSDDLRQHDPALAAQLALAAYRTSPTLQARSSLLDSTAVPTPTRFVGPVGEMHATASPDGSLLAISGTDGVTRLWLRADRAGSQAATAAGAELGGYVPAGELPATGTGGAIYSSAFSPDGSSLALGTSAGAVLLWDVSDPRTPRLGPTLVSEGSPVHSVAFAGSGTQLAAGTSEPAVLRWALRAGQEPRELPAIRSGFAGVVQSVAYRPDGEVLATGTADGRVRLWSSPVGRAALLGTGSVGASTDFVHAVAFSPDGTLLASGEKNRVARLWDVRNPGTPTPTGEPLGGFTSWVNTVAFSPDGRTLAAGSSDGSARLFAVADGRTTLTLPAPTAVTAAEFVGSGTALLTSEVDGVARLWPLPGPLLGGFPDSIWNVLQDGDASRLVVAPGAVDGAVHVFDTTEPAEARPLATLRPAEAAGRADGAAAMTADGQWIAAGTATGNVAVWERSSHDRYRLAGTVRASDQLVESVAFADARSLVGAIADDGSVTLWALEPGQAPRPAARLDVPTLPLGMTFSADGSTLAVATTDGTIHRWRIPELDPTGTVSPRELPILSGFENYVYAVAFDPSGRYLAAGSTDRTVRIWDVSVPESAVAVGPPVRGPGDTIYQLSWRADGQELAAASKDGRLWIWSMDDVANPVALASLSAAGSALYAVQFAPDGLSVLAAGTSQAVHGWQVDTEAVAAGTCLRTGTGMSRAEWEQVAPGVPYEPPCPGSDAA